jgi:hypothetical protein
VYDLSTNYFFYKFLNKNIKLSDNGIFKLLKSEEIEIKKINNYFANLNFYTNPELNFIFTYLVPSGQHLELAVRNKVINLIFAEKRFNSTCNFKDYNIVKSKVIGEFSFENKIWVICEIKY